jgi:hypothetical protein
MEQVRRGSGAHPQHKMLRLIKRRGDGAAAAQPSLLIRVEIARVAVRKQGLPIYLPRQITLVDLAQNTQQRPRLNTRPVSTH